MPVINNIKTGHLIKETFGIFYYYAAVAIVIALAFVIYMRWEAGAAILTRVLLSDATKGFFIINETPGGNTVRSRDSSKQSDDLKERLRLLHISDIHSGTRAYRMKLVRQLIRDASPDVTIITGDYIDSKKDIPAFLAFMRDLTDELSKVELPVSSIKSGVSSQIRPIVFLCFGNHDHRAFRNAPRLKRDLTQALLKIGVRILENKSEHISFNGKVYEFTGFSDLKSPGKNASKAYATMSDGVDFSVGFSHNPDFAFLLNKPRPDLFLCGHFHGGQIRLPFHLEYTCLRRDRLCRMGVRRGLHLFNGHQIYISAGLGCVLFPLRFLSRPEITLFLC